MSRNLRSKFKIGDFASFKATVNSNLKQKCRFWAQIVANTIQMLGRAESGSSTGGSSEIKNEQDTPPVTMYNEDAEQGDVFSEGDDLPF